MNSTSLHSYAAANNWATSPSSSTSTSATNSTTSSPALRYTSFNGTMQPPTLALSSPAEAPFAPGRRPSTTISSIPEDSVPDQLNERPAPAQINYHDVTVNLTDLLGCEAVRNDPKMRSWAQARLMEAQQELRRERRRRLTTPPGGMQSRKVSS